MKSHKFKLALSSAALMLACIAPVSANAETTNSASQVSTDLSVIYQAAQQTDLPSLTVFGQDSKPSDNGFSPFRFEAAAIGETSMKLDNALPTVSFVTATGTTTATNILYSTGTTTTLWYSNQIFSTFSLQTTGNKGAGFKSSYSTASTVANQAGYYRGISAHTVAVLSDVFVASTSNTIAKN